MTRSRPTGLPIRWKLPLLVCGVSLAVASAILWTAYREVRRSALALNEERLGAAMTGLGERLSGQFQTATGRLHELVGHPDVPRYFRAPTPENLDLMMSALGFVRPSAGNTLQIDAVDLAGQRFGPVTEDWRPLVIPDQSELVAWSGGPDSAGIGVLQASGDTLVYPIIAQVADSSGLVGYLLVWQRMSLGGGNAGLIADLVGPDARFILGSLGGAWTEEGSIIPPPPIEPADTTTLQRIVEDTGETWLASVHPIAGSPWVVAIALPERGILAPARRFLFVVGAASLLIVAVGAVLGGLMSRRISRPLGALTLAAEAVGEGEHRVRVPVMSNDEVGRLAATFNRMAERVDQEAVARALAEEQWRLLFVENPHPMWVFDQESAKFLAVNEAAVANYGYTPEEFLSMSVEEIRPEADIPLFRESRGRAPGAGAPEQFRHCRKDGRELDVEIRTQAITFNRRPARLVLAQDISARVALEAVVRQSQKMEAVGRLAGGIAHDFNNFLAVIMTYTELAREGLGEEEPRAAELAEIARAAERAHGLTRQLLAFSRQQVVQPAVFSPGEAVRATEQMLRRLLGERVSVSVQIDEGSGHVLLDRGQFEQVLLNLALNARDAMPSGGTLSLTVSTTELDEPSAALHGVPDTGRFVVLSVADSGVGMSPEVRSRIFEPFFTTKEAGKGTGLGLATAYGTVQQAGGNIIVYSEPGAGTVFRIYLPEVEGRPGVAAQPTRDAPFPRGNETILLVEDDAAVRAAATAALQRLGYVVLSAQGATEARALMARRGDAVHLVMSDVVMPETDGPTLIREFRVSHPAARAILMSGYTGSAVSVRQGQADGVAFLEKPFTVGLLAKTVREVLDGGVQEGGTGAAT